MSFAQAAPYGPASIRSLFIPLAKPPSNEEVALHRFKHRRNIRLDGEEDVDSSRKLHRHFCFNGDDRRIAHQEAMADIEDAATGAARLADTMFVGFGIRPEWPPSKPLAPQHIHLDVIMTRQLEQYPALKEVVDRITRIVQQELAIPHILAYSHKLNEVTPGPGYALDAETRRITLNPIRLASAPIITTPLSDTPRDASTTGPSQQGPNTAPSEKVPTAVPARPGSTAEVSQHSPIIASPQHVLRRESPTRAGHTTRHSANSSSQGTQADRTMESQYNTETNLNQPQSIHKGTTRPGPEKQPASRKEHTGNSGGPDATTTPSIGEASSTTSGSFVFSAGVIPSRHPATPGAATSPSQTSMSNSTTRISSAPFHEHTKATSRMGVPDVRSPEGSTRAPSSGRRHRSMVDRAVMTDRVEGDTSRASGATINDPVDSFRRMTIADLEPQIVGSHPQAQRLTTVLTDAPPSYNASSALLPDARAHASRTNDGVTDFLDNLEVDRSVRAEIFRALNYHHTDWETCFIRAGLSQHAAGRLKALLFEELSPETQAVMTAASNAIDSHSGTTLPSVSSTESSVTASED